jgi:hypothetical protein
MVGDRRNALDRHGALAPFCRHGEADELLHARFEVAQLLLMLVAAVSMARGYR